MVLRRKKSVLDSEESAERRSDLSSTRIADHG